MTALGDRLRLAARIVSLGSRTAGGRLRARVAAPLSRPWRTPEKVLIAPQDLRTTDPTRAGEIYAGTFALEGKRLEAGGGSPFSIPAPSQDWAKALHGFGWLRHLRAADTALARANARALVDEWISLQGGPDPAARAPEVTARRLISWLCHATLIVDGADQAFYRRFLKSLARQSRRLAAASGAASDGAPRILVNAALCYAGLCLSGEPRALKAAAKTLGEELDRQILADGGHVGRNPATLIELLLDLIPLRQAFAARSVSPPQGLISAIDRMTPMLRFFRHGDGDFAQFNGAGPTSADLVATILAYDDARGAPVEDASHSGYQRLSAGAAIALMDAGPPPPFGLSGKAHAGCLSFEFSSGPDRIVVNCGAPRFGRDDWADAARATAAHSTVALADESSCRFAAGRLRRLIGARVLTGPQQVVATRTRDERGVSVVAAHDGYSKPFGLLHERTLTLSSDGRRLSGVDAVRAAPDVVGRGGGPRVALRFHLHPSAHASAWEDGQGVVLSLPTGASWVFSSPGFTVMLEESVYLASAHGPRRSAQIVIYAEARTEPHIAWAFEQGQVDPSQKRRLPISPDFAPLPL